MVDINISELEIFDTEEKLGEGAFGIVRKGNYKGKVVAVKTIKGNNKDNQDISEVSYLKVTDSHKNIVQLYGTCSTKLEIHLVMEFMEGGSLHHLLHESKTPYIFAEAINWMLQAAEALAYLHSRSERSVIHRDVKPQNMLLDRSGDILKICDFGFVRDVKTQMSGYRGTSSYMAPEVFTCDETGKCKYDAKCDVYSMGITIWEVLSRKIVYYEEKKRETIAHILFKINNGLRPLLKDIIFDCPENMRALITSCWDQEPANRPSMQAIVDTLMTILAAEMS